MLRSMHWRVQRAAHPEGVKATCYAFYYDFMAVIVCSQWLAYPIEKWTSSQHFAAARVAIASSLILVIKIISFRSKVGTLMFENAIPIA